jgi:hypothetical protein
VRRREEGEINEDLNALDSDSDGNSLDFCKKVV